ncbi:MAG: alkyl sulfatase dimerization domain-containing protein, partial [Polyangiales bacterium]
MGRVRDQFERYWYEEVDPEVEHPFAPLFALEEIDDKVAFVSSFANATAVKTDEGLVLVDTGSFLFASQAKVAIRGWSDELATRVVYTHGHVDHCFGVELWEEEARSRGKEGPHVIAHEATPARFDRYSKTRGWNACINLRQFSGGGRGLEWPANFRYPDETYRASLDLVVGDEPIELRHARGETDDATWVFLPERRVAIVGDLFIWASPNAGNPQKVQRYAIDWAQALRAIRAREPEVLLPGHGPPIWGAANVSRALDETASLLESLHDQTVALMNEGARLDTILGEVRPPAHLMKRPYLRPIYDEPEFVVRNVVRFYGGWWDGNPANLKPAREADLARELSTLAGGPRVLATRAMQLLDKNDLALACHLAELAAQAAPADEEVSA